MPSLKERKNKFSCDYSQLISSAAVIFVVLDDKGKIVELNGFALDLLGCKEEEAVGKNWFDLSLFESKRRKKTYKDIMSGKIEPARTHKDNIISSSGKQYAISWFSSYIYGESGKIQYAVSIGYDVTAESAKEKEYSATIQLMNSIFHTSPQAILSFDRNLVISQWNEAAEKIFGYRKEEVIGKVSPIAPKSTLKAIKKMYDKIFEDGESFSYEGLRKRKDGSDVIIMVYAGPVRDESGKVVGAMALIEDITAKKEEEKTRAYLKFGIEKSDSAIFLSDKQGKIIYVNPAFENLYGFTQSEVLGKTSRFLKSEHQDDTEYDRRWSDIKAGKNIRNEIINKTKDGREIIVSNSTNSVADTAGNIIGFITLQHDITEETRNKNRLQELTDLNQKIIDSSPLGIFILNREGVVEYVNQEMLEISGSPKAKLIGFNLVNNENYIKLGLSAKIMDAMHQGMTFETEPIRYRSLFGKKETYRIFSGTPIKSSGGKTDKILITVKDVSELAHHNAELERFNSLMVGRELKMVELKNQIQQLRSRLDQLAQNEVEQSELGTETSKTVRRRALRGLAEKSEELIASYGRLFSEVIPGSGLGLLKKFQLRHLTSELINKNIECKKILIKLSEKNETR